MTAWSSKNEDKACFRGSLDKSRIVSRQKYQNVPSTSTRKHSRKYVLVKYSSIKPNITFDIHSGRPC